MKKIVSIVVSWMMKNASKLKLCRFVVFVFCKLTPFVAKRPYCFVLGYHVHGRWYVGCFFKQLGGWSNCNYCEKPPLGLLTRTTSV